MRENKAERLQNRISPEINALREEHGCLHLATVDKNGAPHSSYAPFVYHDLCYYVLVTELAIHGQNLKNNKNVGIAIIEDERQAKDIFARRRITYTAIATNVERHTEHWEFIISALEKRAGETTTILAQLGDFELYRLAPIEGRYVKGFGKAYLIDTAELPKIKALNG